MRKEVILKPILKMRAWLGVFIIALTGWLFYSYLRDNPEIFSSLADIPLLAIPGLLILYSLFLLTNFVITDATIQFCAKRFPRLSSLQLTIYSTLVNFFGPLQSGPGFRAVYLKHKIGLGIKKYTLATTIYYIFFALISLAMLLHPLTHGFSWLLLLVAVGAWFYFKRKGKLAFSRRFIAIIFAATFLQLAIVSLIYFLELSALDYKPGFGSLLSYTGSANLALFVAITPGAIGIRESFIYFAQSIHHVPTEQIVAAGLIDRAVYIIFLGALFALSTSWHLKSKLSR